MSLRLSVADIGYVIIGRPSSGIMNAFPCFFDQFIQMCTTGMAVSVTAFDNDLGFAEVLDTPSAAEPE